MRVGERTDFDRLFLEIETDGIIEPEQAFYRAADILINHFSSLADAFQPKAAAENIVKAVKKVRKGPVKKTKNEKKKKGKKTK